MDYQNNLLKTTDLAWCTKWWLQSILILFGQHEIGFWRKIEKWLNLDVFWCKCLPRNSVFFFLPSLIRFSQRWRHASWIQCNENVKRMFLCNMETMMQFVLTLMKDISGPTLTQSHFTRFFHLNHISRCITNINRVNTIA